MDVLKMAKVLCMGYTPHEVDPELYDEDADDLDIIAPDYINRLGTEYGKKVIYWEENYCPSAYRLSEEDGATEAMIIKALEERGVDFSTDLVAKYPDDYKPWGWLEKKK